MDVGLIAKLQGLQWRMVIGRWGYVWWIRWLSCGSVSAAQGEQGHAICVTLGPHLPRWSTPGRMGEVGVGRKKMLLC